MRGIPAGSFRSLCVATGLAFGASFSFFGVSFSFLCIVTGVGFGIFLGVLCKSECFAGTLFLRTSGINGSRTFNE